MIQSNAVGTAVRQQLEHEGRWPPKNANKIMGSDYRYDRNTLALFLTAVADRLVRGKPAYYFSFDSKFVRDNLTSSVGALVGAVDEKTGSTPPKRGSKGVS